MAQKESHEVQHWKMQSHAPVVEIPPAEIQKGLESSSAENDLQILADKANQSQQRAPEARKAKHILGYININMDRRLRAELAPLALALARLFPVGGFQAENSLTNCSNSGGQPPT